jgi:cell division protein FtsW
MSLVLRFGVSTQSVELWGIVINLKNRLQSDLFIFLAISTILTFIGFIFIYSSSSVYASEKLGSSNYFVKKHIIGLFLALFGLVVARLFPLKLIHKLTPIIFLSSLFLTGLTLIPAISSNIHGSSRWLNLGFIGLQPSEFLKVAFILYLAYFLAKKENSLNSFVHSYLPILCMLGMTCAILLKQPDFGLTATLFATAFIIMFIAQVPLRYILGTLALMLPAAFALIYWQPYRLKRILTFLNPWDDPQGAGFQIIQSLIAIGSGGFSGVGIAQSKQKFFYLPMHHTDFIFSIVAEETGFLGSCILISLFVMFLFFGIRIATQLHDQFSKLATFGFVTLISMQAAINILVATGLVPTKGMGLPFISYGNTSLIATMIMIGLIINMVQAQKLTRNVAYGYSQPNT